MAGRNPKAGLDYFSIDCHTPEKVRLIQAEFGLKGFAIVVKLHQKIFGELGYYCEWNEDSSLLFMSENGVSSRDEQNLIKEIVQACIRRDIFSDRLFKEYGILTSAEVQEAYFSATARRESVKLKKEYLLISADINSISANINSISADINSISAGINSQSRVEKSRVEKSRVDENSGDSAQRVIDAWNAQGLPEMVSMDKGTHLAKMLAERIDEVGIDAVLDAVGKAGSSSFLKGGGRKGWIATFEWFVRPGNFSKVLEGQYDDWPEKGRKGSTLNNYGQRPDNDYAEIQRELVRKSMQ